MQITLAHAIKQLRDDIRNAVLEGSDQDIVFTPRDVELELAITFATEVNVGGGFKLLSLLDFSTGAKASDGGQHKIKLTLDVADKEGNQIKVLNTKQPANFR